MTQPDELIPLGALSATGLAALAAKTQEDWEDELYGGVEDKINPLSELFALVTEAFLGVVNKIVEVFSDFVDLDSAISTLDDILQFFYSIGDRSGFFTVLDAVITFFTDAGEAFYDTLLQVINFFTDLTGLSNASNLDTFLEVFGEIVDFFASIASGVRDGFLSTLKTVVESLGSLTGLSNVANLDALLAAMKSVSNFVAGIANFSTWSTALKSLIDGLLGVGNLSTWTAVLKQVTDFFAGISDAVRPFWLDLLDDIVLFFGSITSFSTWTTALKSLIDGLLGIANFSTWVAAFKQVVDSFVGLGNSTVIGTFLTVLNQVINFFGTITAGVRANFLAVFKQVTEAFVGLGNSTVIGTFLSVFTQVINFFGTIASGSRAAFLAAIQTVVEFFQGVITSFGSLPTWLAGLPSLASTVIGEIWSLLNGGAEAIGKTIDDVLESIGSFVSSLIPNLTGVPGALGLGDVSTWARNLLDKGLTWPDLKTLFGDIPASILGVLPIPNISLVNPELMSQGGFDTSTTLAPGSGWTWDSATHSGSSGSAKVAGAATTRALYSNQAIEVAQGDKLLVSCWVKSTGTVGAGGIVLSIVEFNGTTQGTTRTIASRASSTPWVQIGDTVTSTYTVGAGVTSIRVRLAITSAAASGSYVWFDDISVKKTGLLDGSWMEGLLGTVVDDFQTIADSIAQAIQSVGTAGTGNALTTVLTNIQSIFSRLFGIVSLPASLLVTPLLEVAIPGLSGGKITSGSVSADFLPIDDIGAEINPGVGSGATLTRTGATTYNATTGRNAIGTGFYNTLSSSTDITALTSGGQYTGQFQVSMDGWYLCEISYLINPSAGYDWNVAPLLYKNGSPFRIGSDAMLVNAVVANAQRYAQSSFIVYLTAGQNVGAGYDASGAFTGIFSGSGSSVDTYFSVSLLNKSYA